MAADYYRVNQAEAIESLGQQCFAERKKNKAKTLKAQQDLNLWPRAPLTEKFDYELVKLEGNIQNIQIKSYATKQNQPTFYWPFVVFLDQKGCVIEGAGGFRNQYILMAIDRATRWVFVQFKANKTAASAQAFLKALHKACPIRINKLLTDNGKEFTNACLPARNANPAATMSSTNCAGNWA